MKIMKNLLIIMSITLVSCSKDSPVPLVIQEKYDNGKKVFLTGYTSTTKEFKTAFTVATLLFICGDQ